MRERIAVSKAGSKGPLDVALLASFVVNAVRWGEKVSIAGKPLKLTGTWKDEQKSHLRDYMTKNPKAYTELMGDFGTDLARFKKENPRKSKQRSTV